jgi:hypothetical protein
MPQPAPLHNFANTFAQLCPMGKVGQIAVTRDMPTVAPTIARIATVGKVEAESWQNPLNLDNQFLH